MFGALCWPICDCSLLPQEVKPNPKISPDSNKGFIILLFIKLNFNIYFTIIILRVLYRQCKTLQSYGECTPQFMIYVIKLQNTPLKYAKEHIFEGAF